MNDPNIQILDDILIPIKLIVERLYWNGFRDGAALTAILFILAFLVSNKGVNR